jgi:autotransporter translocation and assembly factor TamB
MLISNKRTDGLIGFGIEAGDLKGLSVYLNGRTNFRRSVRTASGAIGREFTLDAVSLRWSKTESGLSALNQSVMPQWKSTILLHKCAGLLRFLCQ